MGVPVFDDLIAAAGFSQAPVSYQACSAGCKKRFAGNGMHMGVIGRCWAAVLCCIKLNVPQA